MNTDLHGRLEHQRALVFFLCLLLAGSAILVTSYVVRINRLQAVQFGMVKAAHQRHVEAEMLCAAVKDQEYIIRREAPHVASMSWAAALREICK